VCVDTQRLSVSVLGPLEVMVGSRPVPIRTPRLRTLIAVLAMSAGQTVPVDRLNHALWDEQTPHDTRGSLQTYVSRLRTLLGKPTVVWRPGGFLLDADPDDIDALRFGRLLESAHTADTAAEQTLASALALWRGEPFVDIDAPRLKSNEAPNLLEHYLHAHERHLDIKIARGGNLDDLIPQLAALTSRHPLRETLWTRLLKTLDQAGRKAEALERYEAIRARIADELGVDPGPELQQIHATLLAKTAPQQPISSGTTQRRSSARLLAMSRSSPPTPAMANPSQRTARARPAAIAAITGTAGVGKTTLAVHWGHRVREWFPDGQLYVNLRGFGPGDPMDPAVALELLLEGMGIAAERIPADIDARSALLRSVLAEHRVLLVFDNARDAAQVRPLLPGAGCVVLITSRDQLRGLSVHGDITNATLDIFSSEESAALLQSMLGDRARTEPEASAELGRLCAHLPLALRIAVANLLLDRHQRVAEYVAELRKGDRLDILLIDGD
jgi:DNA-binding SARP family transcriptional activator